MDEDRNIDASSLGGDPTENAGQQQEQKTKQKSEATKPVSFAEFLENPANQSEFDKRVTKALETARAKWEAESKLSDEEKASQKMTEREQSLDQREAELNKREFTAAIKDKLLTKKLPAAFAEVLAEGCSDETIDATLSAIEQEWAAQMNEQIKAVARQKEPLAGGVQVEASARDNLAEFARKNRKVK